MLIPEPAKIVDKPDYLSVTAGDIAALEVKVCGTPELTPKWFKDGVELASGRKYKISFSRMISSLNVLSAEKVDSGEYTFEVMNEVGKDLSKINLTVLGWYFDDQGWVLFGNVQVSANMIPEIWYQYEKRLAVTVF